MWDHEPFETALRNQVIWTFGSDSGVTVAPLIGERTVSVHHHVDGVRLADVLLPCPPDAEPVAWASDAIVKVLGHPHFAKLAKWPELAR